MKTIGHNSKIKKRSVFLPDFFKPIMWSYDFSKIDAEKDKKTIILNTINYGDLKHWRWIEKRYGQPIIQEILGNMSVTEIRPKVLKLVALIFSIKDFNYAPRGTK